MRFSAAFFLLLSSGCIQTEPSDILRKENERLRTELEVQETREEESRLAEEMAQAKERQEWPLHVVKNREVLSDIAVQFYGDPTGWEEIYEANRHIIGTDPNRLEIGMELRIPPQN